MLREPFVKFWCLDHLRDNQIAGEYLNYSREVAKS